VNSWYHLGRVFFLIVRILLLFTQYEYHQNNRHSYNITCCWNLDQLMCLPSPLSQSEEERVWWLLLCHLQDSTRGHTGGYMGTQ
jgi:hypothetical protein